MEPPLEINLKQMLPYGAMSVIAKQLGISTPAVSRALKIGRPGSRVVQEALRMAKESGGIAAAHTLASLIS